MSPVGKTQENKQKQDRNQGKKTAQMKRTGEKNAVPTRVSAATAARGMEHAKAHTRGAAGGGTSAQLPFCRQHRETPPRQKQTDSLWVSRKTSKLGKKKVQEKSDIKRGSLLALKCMFCFYCTRQLEASDLSSYDFFNKPSSPQIQLMTVPPFDLFVPFSEWT